MPATAGGSKASPAPSYLPSSLASRMSDITFCSTLVLCAFASVAYTCAIGVHTAASSCPRVATQILRHSKIAVTMETYTEVPSAATRDALKNSVSGSGNEPRCCTLPLHQDQKRLVQ
jgi:hypothetical protein